MLGEGAEKLRAMNREDFEGGPWPDPDLGVLKQGRRDAPPFPNKTLGGFWGEWVAAAAEGANAPIDYCAMPLLAVAATLVGNARAISPWDGWREASVLWCGVVGDPSSNKSPGLAPVLDLVRGIEDQIGDGFDDIHRRWETEREMAKANLDQWKFEVKEAAKSGRAPPLMPPGAIEPVEPVRPRVMVNDTTPEKLGELCAAHPKGLTFFRDELAGWFGAFDRYSGSGAERALWLEAYQGNSYTIDRVKSERAIRIPHFAIGVLGGIQPERLVDLLEGPDDGLTSRFTWSWPEPIPPKRPAQTADRAAAVKALMRLAQLKLGADDFGNPQPRVLRLDADAADVFHQWRQEHAAESRDLAGALASAWGKAPGHLLRLALVLEHIWWCGNGEGVEAPNSISRAAVTAAAVMVEDYNKPMAARVYGDAALPERDRLAATLARWVLKTKPTIINAKKLRREARLPGLKEADKVKLALDGLEDADWLRPAPTRQGGTPGRARADYAVNPKIVGIANGK
jgi:hypothetical protein